LLPAIIKLTESRVGMIKSVKRSTSSNGHSDEPLIKALRRIDQMGGPEVVLEKSKVEWSIPYSK
jgi:hypothetical protein